MLSYGLLAVSNGCWLVFFWDHLRRDAQTVRGLLNRIQFPQLVEAQEIERAAEPRTLTDDEYRERFEAQA